MFDNESPYDVIFNPDDCEQEVDFVCNKINRNTDSTQPKQKHCSE